MAYTLYDVANNNSKHVTYYEQDGGTPYLLCNGNLGNGIRLGTTQQIVIPKTTQNTFARSDAQHWFLSVNLSNRGRNQWILNNNNSQSDNAGTYITAIHGANNKYGIYFALSTGSGGGPADVVYTGYVLDYNQPGKVINNSVWISKTTGIGAPAYSIELNGVPRPLTFAAVLGGLAANVLPFSTIYPYIISPTPLGTGSNDIFTGTLSALQIYKGVVTPTQRKYTHDREMSIHPDFIGNPVLVANYRCNERTGDVLTDFSVNSNHGELQGYSTQQLELGNSNYHVFSYTNLPLRR